jgi:hypothetical protein
MDESAIEAEAIRHSTDDLERIDRLMASAEARRNKALADEQPVVEGWPNEANFRITVQCLLRRLPSDRR